MLGVTYQDFFEVSVQLSIFALDVVDWFTEEFVLSVSVCTSYEKLF